MILYHGSTDIIKVPSLEKGRKNNDFGQGFYCTSCVDSAGEWACSKGTDGFVNIYEFDATGLTTLDLNAPPYNPLTWLAILAHHRTCWINGDISERTKNCLETNFLVPTDSFDVVRGFRADNSYFTFAKDFIANKISLPLLEKVLYLGALGEQIVLRTERALSQLKFKGSIPATPEIYTKQARLRNREVQGMYRELLENLSFDEVFAVDIVRLFENNFFEEKSMFSIKELLCNETFSPDNIKGRLGEK